MEIIYVFPHINKSDKMPTIKDIEIYELGEMGAEKSSPWSSTILVVKMVASDGTVGYGEAPTTLMTLPVYEELKEMSRIFIGREVTEIQKNYMEVYKHSFYLPVSVESTAALSALEIASWDITGKIYGMPVYDAFGGRMREDVRAYANGWYDNCVSPEDFVAKAKAVVKMGFSGVKFDPFRDAYDNINAEQLDHAESVVKAMRSSFPKLDLMIECHGRFNANSAIRAGHALEKYNPPFIEEPVHPDQFEGLLRFKNEVSIPVALGERVMNSNLFLNYMTNSAVDVIQPDITNFGGMLQGKSVAAMAQAFGIEVAYHNAFGPIQTAATLNLDYTIPNLLIQESFEAFWPAWKKKLVKSGYSIENGRFSLAKGRPGLGITIDERIMEEYKVKGIEPFNPSEPAWVVGGTFAKPSATVKKRQRHGSK
jgi:L-alanine-DL-glutamate epimerase-like enolase superfamily enzyme